MKNVLAWPLAAVLMLCLCLSVELWKSWQSRQPRHFFGAWTDSKYQMHFDNKMRCAYVIGWHDERQCLCILIEDDDQLGNSRTLLAAVPSACESKSDEIQPE